MGELLELYNARVKAQQPDGTSETMDTEEPSRTLSESEVLNDPVISKMYARMASNTQIDPDSFGTITDNIGKGTQKGRGLLANLAASTAIKSPKLGAALASDSFTGAFMPKSLRSALIEAYSDEEIRAKVEGMTEEERAEYYTNAQSQNADKYYRGTYNKPGWQAAGSLVQALQDPSSLAPIGATKLGAAGIGGTIGAADSVLYSMAESGDYTVTDLIVGAALGAGLGLGIKYAGEAFIPTVKEHMASGRPLTRETLEDLGVPYSREYLDSLNESVSLSSADYIKNVLKTDTDFFKAAADNYSPTALEPQMALREASETILEEGTEAQVRKAAQMEQAYADRMLQNSMMAHIKEKEVLEGFEVIAQMRKADASAAVTEPPPNTAMADGLKKAIAESETTAEEFKKFIPKGQSGSMAPWMIRDLGMASAGGLYGGYEGGDWTSVGMGVIGGLGMGRIGSKIGEKLSPRVGRMMNSVNPPVGEEVADVITRKMSKHLLVQRPAEWFKGIAPGSSHSGAVFAKTLEMMNENIYGSVAFGNMKTRQALGGIKKFSQGSREVADLLRKTAPESSFSPEIRKAAAGVRSLLNSSINQARKAGLITSDKASELLARAKREGYFPRIYDKNFLDTSEGKDLWIKTLTDYKWTKPQLDRALESLVPDSHAPLMFKQAIRKRDSKNGLAGEYYTIDKSLAKKFYQSNSKVTYSTRSSHLQERKIDLPDEVLKPFLVNDVEDVMTSYFQDIYKSIHGSRMFGHKDELMWKFEKDFKNMGLDNDQIDDAWNVYYTTLGDPKSSTIKQFMNMSSKVRNTFNNVSAFETITKLGLAPLTNSLQATINSMIFLSSREGAKTFSHMVNGFKTTITKGGMDFGDYIGASAQSTVMEISGEMGANASQWATWFLKNTGFNAVERFQRAFAANIGKAYTESLIEKKMKLLGQYGGRGLSTKAQKELSRVNDALWEMGIHSRKVKSAADIEAAMKDLDNISVSSVNDASKAFESMTLDTHELGPIARASQRFSNKVNFINTPDQMPILWQSPYAKVLRQFKTYVFHQSAFLHDNLLKPLRNKKLPISKRVAPVLALAAAGGLGMGPAETRRFLYADDENYTGFERYMRGFTSMGGLGVISDVANQARFNESFATSYLGGPFLSDVGKVGKGLAVSAEKGSLKPLGSAITRSLVFPGKKAVQEEFKQRKGGGNVSLYDDPYTY